MLANQSNYFLSPSPFLVSPLSHAPQQPNNPQSITSSHALLSSIHTYIHPPSDLNRVLDDVAASAETLAREQARQAAEVRQRKAEASFQEGADPTPGPASAAEAEAEGGKSKGEAEEEEGVNASQGEDAVSTLELKMKSLQVKIRVQNVQILQTLNREAMSLQREVHGSLCDAVQPLQQERSPLAPQTPSKSVSSASHDMLAVRDRVFTLVADLVDHSCDLIRRECAAGSPRLRLHGMKG